jgi:hypothetical protein
MACYYCTYTYVLITAKKLHDPVNLKQTFSFTANGTYKQKEGRKERKKELGNSSEIFYSSSGIQKCSMLL